MLLEKQIQQALHASRVVPLAVVNPHGPLELAPLATIAAAMIEQFVVTLPNQDETQE